MSLVDPRPYIEAKSTPLDPDRLNMRSGLTGLAQVHGNSSLSREERTKDDLYFNTHFSLRLDLKILLETRRVLLLGESRNVKHFADYINEKQPVS